jgi:hypothetical protein
MIHDDKKALTTIMSRRSKDGSTVSSPMAEEVSKDEDGNVDGRHAAAQDIIMAMHEKSPQKLMEALSNFHDLHMAQAQTKESVEEED